MSSLLGFIEVVVLGVVVLAVVETVVLIFLQNAFGKVCVALVAQKDGRGRNPYMHFRSIESFLWSIYRDKWRQVPF